MSVCRVSLRAALQKLPFSTNVRLLRKKLALLFILSDDDDERQKTQL